jgi:hypothetical protein
VNKRLVLFSLALWSSFLNLNSGINFPSDFESSDFESNDFESNEFQSNGPDSYGDDRSGDADSLNFDGITEPEEIIVESTKSDAQSIEDFGPKDLSEFSLDDLQGEYKEETISAEVNSQSDLNSMDINDLEAELDFDDDDFGGDEDLSELSKDELSEIFSENGSESGGGGAGSIYGGVGADSIYGGVGAVALTTLIKGSWRGVTGFIERSRRDANMQNLSLEKLNKFSGKVVKGGIDSSMSGQGFGVGAIQGGMTSRRRDEMSGDYDEFGDENRSYSDIDSGMDDDNFRMQSDSFDDLEGPSRSTGYDDSGPIRSGGMFDFSSKPSKSYDSSGPTRPSRSGSGSSSKRRR